MNIFRKLFIDKTIYNLKVILELSFNEIIFIFARIDCLFVFLQNTNYFIFLSGMNNNNNY